MKLVWLVTGQYLIVLVLLWIALYLYGLPWNFALNDLHVLAEILIIISIFATLFRVRR